MNDFQRGILAVIKSGFTGEKASVAADFPWAEAVKFAKAQSLEVMLFLGAEKSGVQIPAEVFSTLQKRAMLMLAYAVRQDSEADRIFALLRDKNIDFLPLKGAILRHMYPETGMRFMSDIDVLIKSEQYPAVEKLMRDEGYSFVCESDHEYIWDRKNILHIEFHRRLIPSYNKDYFAYYGDGWRPAKRDNGSEYKMSDEDFLIYIFTHLAKHYRDSGIGLKHFIDIWVYLSKKPELDMEYVEAELEKLQLSEFFKNVRAALKVWFEGGAENEKSDMITNWSFSGGAYVCYEKKVLSSAVKEAADRDGKKDSRIMRVAKAAFMPYALMCQKYPFLRKAPVLLPVMWLVRIASAAIFKRGNIKKRNSEINMMTDTNVDGYHTALNRVGLDFNFKE